MTQTAQQPSRAHRTLAVGYVLLGVVTPALGIVLVLLLAKDGEVTLRFDSGAAVTLFGVTRILVTAGVVLWMAAFGAVNLLAARWLMRGRRRVGVQVIALLDAVLMGWWGVALAVATLVVLHGPAFAAWLRRTRTQPV